MQTINAILALFFREYKITFRNYYYVLTIMLFFILGLIIFIFSIGINNKDFNELGIGIIWVLLLLRSNLSIRKFYQDDFNDGNLFIMHMSGLSYELIVLII